MPSLGFIRDIDFSTLGIWAMLAAISTWLIRTWPHLKLQATQAKEKLREEGRTDLSDCKERLDRMAGRMDGLSEIVNNLKIELSAVLCAYRVLEVAEVARDPQSIHLAQARAILSTAFTIAPSTTGPIGKSETLRAAEKTCHAAEVTVEQVLRDEAEERGED